MTLFAMPKSSNRDKIEVIRNIFRDYLEAKREFDATTEQFVLRGWPDRKDAIERLNRLGALVRECEHLRFNFLIKNLLAETQVWTSIASIANRLHKGWKDNEDIALGDENPRYRAVMKELETLKLASDPSALEGPYSAAEGDRDWQEACVAFAVKHAKLDEELTELSRDCL